MIRRGFTIIEIMVVIAVIGILLALAFAGYRSTQPAARDSGLKADAEAIARGLENYYKTGNPTYSIPAGKYPSVNELLHAQGQVVADVGPQVVGGYLGSWLSGVNSSSINRLKSVDTTKSVGTPDSSSIVSAYIQTGQIIYEPLIFTPGSPDSFAFCTTKASLCTNFNLYYKTEVDGAMHVIRSEHQ